LRDKLSLAMVKVATITLQLKLYRSLLMRISVTLKFILMDKLEFIFEDKEVDERFLHRFEIISVLRVINLLIYC
jgi:hypothetical protein